MKTIKRFFNWIISLFKKKPVEVPAPVMDIVPRPEFHISNPVTPPHNNRKRKKGRKLQYINSDKRNRNRMQTRAIYHSAK